MRGTSGGAQAMLLAAGRGERMRPLTDSCPKPLLEVRGKPLMQYHLEALGRAGLCDIAINVAWLGGQVMERFGSNPPLGPGGQPLALHYSDEGRDFGGALETAGGIARALPLLQECFWLVGGDVHVPLFEFSRPALERFATGNMLAHLVLVPNPQHNPRGDFGLRSDGRALNTTEGPRYTYSTIGLFRHALFVTLPAGNPQGIKAPLAPLLRAGMDNGQVSAEIYTGPWTDVGTPQRLAQLNTP